MRKHASRAVFLLLGLWMIVSALSLKSSALGETPIYSGKLTQQDVTISVEPLLDEELVKKTIHKLLVESRITPVKVTIRNDRSEPIRVTADGIQLIDRFGAQYRSFSATEISHEAARRESPRGRRPPIHAPIPIPPTPRRGMPGPGKMKDLEFAILGNELGDRVVPPHGEEQGFLFFRINGGANMWSGAKVYIPQIRAMKTAERLLFFEIELQTSK
ncbi:MAG: hypothetical protein HYR55_09640 [Acidobacteria bacterium]|nr:hypothetical protein [Acidobacteriota bacterium]MBI3656745.1 hypothetical protein [Acidobacteriota bacterium]